MARISRPNADASSDDIRRYLRALGAELERLGICYGEPFEVIPARKAAANIYELETAVEDAPGPAASSAASARGSLKNLPQSGTQRRRILEAAVAAGDYGITSDEVSAALDIPLQSAKVRVLELRQNGWLAFNGKTRPSMAGAVVEVHVATDRARAELGMPTGPTFAATGGKHLEIQLADTVGLADGLNLGDELAERLWLDV